MGILGKEPGEKAQAAARAPHQVQVELPEREAEGIYSNLVLMTHSASEFIFDFARVLPGAHDAPECEVAAQRPPEEPGEFRAEARQDPRGGRIPPPS
jgi:hypothetical protein